MKIPALRIEINGELIAIAGAENLSLLTGQIGLGSGSSTNIDLERILFSVMGLDVRGARPRQLTWGDGIHLKVGDRVTFQVVEVENPSPPNNVRASPGPEELASSAATEKKAARKRGRGA